MPRRRRFLTLAMIRLLSLVVVTVTLIGCRYSPSSHTAPVHETSNGDSPLGLYRTESDPVLARIGFDFTLDFKLDGSYVASGKIPKGEGMVSGQWERRGDQISLIPRSVEGGLSAYLDRFEITLDPYRDEVLVLKPETDFGESRGATTYPILRKVVDDP